MKPLAASATQITVGKLSRSIDYGDPAVTWKTVVAELEKIRSDPVGAAGRAAATFAALADQGAFDGLATGDVDPAAFGLGDGFVLLPDMPAPELDVQLRRRGPAGATPEPVSIPPLEPLTTGDAWFDAVDGNPFHGGLLSGLRAYA
jgi:hypothetical protein